jgi:hypothetical protein
MDNFSGLWLADYIGSFLTAGGNGVYYFHYLPLQADRGCNNSTGTFGMFSIDKDYKIQQPLPQFFSSQLINTEWIEPGKEVNTIFPAASNIDDGAGHAMVTAYAVSRPDKKWSVMLVNRDQEAGHTVKIVFKDAGEGKVSSFQGDVEIASFGKLQYAWHPVVISPMSHPESARDPVIASGTGLAKPDGPVKREKIRASTESEFQVPAASIVVIRGTISLVQ